MRNKTFPCIIASMISTKRHIPPPKPDEIIKRVQSITHISMNHLKGESQKREIVYARHLNMYLLKKQTALSIKKIGRLLCRDHSSVVHGVQSIQNRMDTEPDIYNEVMALLNYDQKQIIADIMHDDEQSGIYE